MSKRDYSKHQQEVIGRYYQNLDAIMLQKLQELVTELYLTKNGPKEDRLWLRAEKAMVKLKTPKSIREHIMRKRQVEILARNVENWLKNVK
ncbi:MAG: hypothetical protein KAT56_05240 [Sedimentisphaerales bacterium]|nr:hypothetical protein [Sedimentisphaerales bacterium]